MGALLSKQELIYLKNRLNARLVKFSKNETVLHIDGVVVGDLNVAVGVAGDPAFFTAEQGEQQRQSEKERQCAFH